MTVEPLPGRELMAIRARVMRARDKSRLTQAEKDRDLLVVELYRLRDRLAGAHVPFFDEDTTAIPVCRCGHIETDHNAPVCRERVGIKPCPCDHFDPSDPEAVA